MRFCGQCKQNVYNLSEMTQSQVEALLATGDRVCGRFYQRADGTVMTADCSVGAKRRRRKKMLVSAGAGVLSALGLAFAGGDRAPAPPNLPMPIDAATGKVAPTEPPTTAPTGEDPIHMKMGEVVYEPEEEIMGALEVVDDESIPIELDYVE